MVRNRRKERSAPLLAAAVALLIGLVLAPALATAAPIPDSQIQRALRKQHRLIEQEPQNAGLWNDLGNLLRLGGSLGEAEDAYKMSLDLDPELTSARYNLALLYQETRRPFRSKQTLRKLLRQKPDHAWGHYYLGVAHAETRQRKLAIKQYALALRLDRDLSDPRINPHVVDNPLMADATLRAYQNAQGAALAPRLYEDRERVVKTMVRPRQLESALSEPEAEEAPEADGAAAEKKPDRRKRSSGNGN